MFEQSPENMKAMKFFDQKEAQLLDQFGIAKISSGFTEITYAQAIDMIEKMECAAPGIPSHLTPRFRACMNGIKSAFGPELLFERKAPDETDAPSR